MIKRNKLVPIALAAMAMTIGTATAGGLTKKQVRTIVKREIAKIQSVQGPVGSSGDTGPAGPQGPTGRPGMDGTQSLFAHISADGTVLGGTGGITQANVHIIEDSETPQALYCFTGINVSGGQVTLDTISLLDGPHTAYLEFSPSDPTCSPRVNITGPEFGYMPASFFVLLY